MTNTDVLLSQVECLSTNFKNVFIFMS